MSWNWQKILKGNKNLPEFDRPVMLFEKKDDKNYATVGMLKSIDANGCNWSTNTTNDIFDMFNMINDLKTVDNKKFKPSHWCEIDIPESK